MRILDSKMFNILPVLIYRCPSFTNHSISFCEFTVARYYYQTIYVFIQSFYYVLLIYFIPLGLWHKIYSCQKTSARRCSLSSRNPRRSIRDVALRQVRRQVSRPLPLRLRKGKPPSTQSPPS